MTAIDLRERVVSVTGQEVMTKDRLTLRLSLAARDRFWHRTTARGDEMRPSGAFRSTA